VTSKVRKFYNTRLDQFLAREEVNLAELARLAGLSRQALGRIRAGRDGASEETIARLVLALRTLLRREVRATDLFDLGPSD
jgi:transcriptional regulator with XRE-family HTH domain